MPCKRRIRLEIIDGKKHEHGYSILATDDILLAIDSTKATMMLEK